MNGIYRKPLFAEGDRVRYMSFRVQGEIKEVLHGTTGFWYRIQLDGEEHGRTLHEDRLQLLGPLESLALLAEE